MMCITCFGNWIKNVLIGDCKWTEQQWSDEAQNRRKQNSNLTATSIHLKRGYNEQQSNEKSLQGDKVILLWEMKKDERNSEKRNLWWTRWVSSKAAAVWSSQVENETKRNNQGTEGLNIQITIKRILNDKEKGDDKHIHKMMDLLGMQYDIKMIG